MSRQSAREAEAWSPEAHEEPSPPFTSNVLTSPLSTFHHRPGYQRLNSAQEEDTSYRGHRHGISELPENDSVHGLRIRFSDHDEEALKVGATVIESPNQQQSATDSYLTPSTARSGTHGRSASTGSSPYDDASSYSRASPSSFHRLEGPFDQEEELLQIRSSASTFRSYDTSGMAPSNCITASMIICTGPVLDFVFTPRLPQDVYPNLEADLD